MLEYTALPTEKINSLRKKMENFIQANLRIIIWETESSGGCSANQISTRESFGDKDEDW